MRSPGFLVLAVAYLGGCATAAYPDRMPSQAESAFDESVERDRLQSQVCADLGENLGCREAISAHLACQATGMKAAKSVEELATICRSSIAEKGREFGKAVERSIRSCRGTLDEVVSCKLAVYSDLSTRLSKERP